MKLHIRNEQRQIRFGDKDFYITNFFNKLLTELQKKFNDFSFEIVNDTNYEKYGQGGIYSCMNFSIVNPENKKYILISFFDNWKYHFMSHLGWDAENMVQFFYPGGFNFYDYYTFKTNTKNNLDVKFPNDIKNIYEPFYYGPYFDCCYDFMNSLYEKNKNSDKEKKLFFRGWLWDFRKKMVNEIVTDDIIIIDKNVDNQNMEYTEYLNDLSKYKVSLSLPGGNEMCNRDIECFGVGIPVIRPHLNINYPDPLIPNFHYISCYHSCDYSFDGHPKYNSYTDFKNNLITTWNRVKNNDEYLNFVSENAKNWFDKNCTLPSNIEYLINRIDLKKLL